MESPVVLPTEVITQIRYLPVAPDGSDPLLEYHFKSPYVRQRRAKLILFSSVLNTWDIFKNKNITDKFSLIDALEKSCFDYCNSKAFDYNIPLDWDNEQYFDLYNLACAKIAANIDRTNSVKNNYLLPAILEGIVSVKNIPKMAPQELYPEMYVAILYKLDKSKNAKIEARTSSLYKCYKCRTKECIIENRYNRSLDEGVNLTITCKNCGHQWNG